VRVFVVARDASLLVALSLMSDRWEVVTAPAAPTERWPEPGFAVGVVDLRTTARGLDVVRGLREAAGRTLPCLVIGEEAVPLADAVEVISRPFSLASLTAAIERVADSPASPLVDPRDGAETSAETAGSAPAPEPAAEPEPALTTSEPAAAPPVPASVALDVVEAVEAKTKTKVPAPSRRDRRAELKKAAKDAARSSQRDERGGRRAGKGSLRGRHSADAPEPELRQTAPLLREPPAAPEAALVAPPVGPAPTAPAPEPEPPLAEPNDREEKLEIIHHWAVRPDRSTPPAVKPAGPSRGFFRKAASTVLADARGQQRHRVEAAAIGAANLASLLGDVRATDTAAVAHAFLEEVVDRLSPQAAALYVSEGATGFRVAASHGLSATESRLVVPADHRLFAEIAATLSGILISPVSMVQGLVAGIGGAWTETLMVVPVAANGVCHGIATVGSDDYSDRDLEDLIALAREGAPLLALGAALGRLRLEFVASETGQPRPT
jgi:hypothetical protein